MAKRKNVQQDESFEGQRMKEIPISKLHLWQDNPRDNIQYGSTNQEIADIALSDKSKTWKIKKLMKEMGNIYDLSEAPIVVFDDKKGYVVYDGNRRMLIALMYHNKVKYDQNEYKNIPKYPDKINCNVCERSTAVSLILRKHGSSGSWTPLERDMFVLTTGDSKSDFLLIERCFGVISKYPSLNKGFVKEEILTKTNLEKVGIFIRDGEVFTSHSLDEIDEIFFDLSEKIKDKTLSTRDNRSQFFDILDEENKSIVQTNKGKKQVKTDESFIPEPNTGNQAPGQNPANKKNQRQSRKTPDAHLPLFGGKLFLREGDVNDLYREISEFGLFLKRKGRTPSATIMLRFSLRLLVETAARDLTGEVSKSNVYVDEYFQQAKKLCDQDTKTSLYSTSISTEKQFKSLLHTGAHDYTEAKDRFKAIAVSIIIGKMLILSHPQKEKEK